ncbi:protein phosphatase [Thermosporothrix hazakensis]|jgi:protein phosphatase|uniref:Protein phosphatase n=2 Tax=Thermosporothrix TaxID=768650 RepID=A0A326UCG6_THEHA|nr:PP2C family serine/threonine-protein phosphatase [Thermosporothrix hazakensis]PZW22979.1 protein phosphatase [Thermosporothrix hazakensis]BBH90070.1 hypothetical protein KTC_48210 [Thermosporothrix sp. COM3]GCE48291.1 hypothetical protein KTH_31600 [Thermosporothrix hazakensis]
MQFKLTAADKTDVGRQREQNEDYVYKRVESAEDGDRGLFIVADGMGGYKAGEIASRIAVETISQGLDHIFKPISEQPTIKIDRAVLQQTQKADTSNQGQSPQTSKLADTHMAQAMEEQLKAAIQQANRKINRYGEEKASARGLGCTVTVALLQGEHVYIGNVGDSRTYLFRKGKLTRLTKDHSVVQRLVETHQIAPDDVYTHPQRNLIYRSLGGGNARIEVDVFHEIAQPGDTFLLCSDGLWEMVRDPDIERIIIETGSPQAICDKLIEQANRNGGEDNITAIIVHVNAC